MMAYSKLLLLLLLLSLLLSLLLIQRQLQLQQTRSQLVLPIVRPQGDAAAVVVGCC